MKRILCAVVALFAITYTVQATCTKEVEDYATYVAKNLPVGTEVLADGVAHYRLLYKSNRIDVFHVNRKYSKDLIVEPVMANNTLRGLRSTGYFHERLKDYILFVNCIYFNLEQNLPIGLLMSEGEFLSGSVYNRSALIVYEDKFRVSRVSMDISVNGVKVHNINQPRMSRYFNLMYTSRWGTLAPRTPENGLQVQVTHDKVSQVSKSQLIIPVGGYVIVGLYKDLKDFKVGQKVNLSVDTIPTFPGAKYIVSGGPSILKDHTVHILSTEEKMGAIGTGAYNRTFACVTDDESLILFTSQGKGTTLQDEADVMKKFNCKEGLNFDGGSSTSGYYKGADGKYYVIADTKRLLPAVLVVKAQ